MGRPINFKRLSLENWLEQDPVLRHFVGFDRRQGSVTRMAAADWVERFLEPQLGEGVPEEVVELIEGARGAMLYGWFFYPLYVIAEDQLCVAAEAALRAKYISVTGTSLPPERLPRFQGLRAWGAKKGLIPKGSKGWWEAMEGMRNLTAHTQIQRLGPPTGALRTLTQTCRHVNALFPSRTLPSALAEGPER